MGSQQAKTKRKEKRKRSDSDWALINFVRNLLRGAKSKKKEDKKQHKKRADHEDQESSALDDHSAKDNSQKKDKRVVVKGNEKTACYNANVEMKKIDELRKSLKTSCKNKQQKVTGQPRTLVSDKSTKTTKTKTPNSKSCIQQKAPAVAEKPKETISPKVEHVLSRRDQERLQERRTKLKIRKQQEKPNKSQATKANTNAKTDTKNCPAPTLKTPTAVAKTSYQLPIGVRGYAQEKPNRPNRFALHYLPEEAQTPEKPHGYDLEYLFEALGELNTGLETLVRSYKNIVKSLIKLQVPANKQSEVSKKWNSQAADDKKSTRNYQENIDIAIEQMTMKRLMDPATKGEAMQELQEMVEELNLALDDLHVFYDDEEVKFDYKEYSESEFRITNQEFDITLKRINKLRSVVSGMLSHYSLQLLDMFSLQP